MLRCERIWKARLRAFYGAALLSTYSACTGRVTVNTGTELHHSAGASRTSTTQRS
ncbi:hypothetical protein KCP69_13990 [Salmonella enterica subsp. enterica]|nr:hypothetical protein KCP69_13990 [Salmonella enterica subsp. enterica]